MNLWQILERLGSAEIERAHVAHAFPADRAAFRAMVLDVIASYAWRRASRGG